MAQQDSSGSRTWVWIAVAVVVAMGLVLYLRVDHGRVTVKVATVERRDVVNTSRTNGIVTPQQDFEAYATASGVVDDIYVDLGDQVKKGQALIRMDDSDARKALASAEANLQSSSTALQNMQQGGSQDEQLTAKNDLANAQLEVRQDTQALATVTRLQAQGAASASEVAAAQRKLSDAQLRVSQLQTRQTGRYGTGDLAAQRAQVNEARAGVAAAQSGVAGVDIRAPFAGTVYAISVAQYDYVQAGKPLLDVADLTKLEVHAYFDEPEIGKLAVGQPVTIVWDAKPNLTWHGKIIQAPTTIIQYGSTRNVGECLISVDDAHGDLLPNTNVTVTVTTQASENALSLPREALHTDGGSNYVFKVVGGKLVKTPIQVGKVVNLTRFEIAGGLQQGDVVALGAINEVDLQNGLSVKVQSSK